MGVIKRQSIKRSLVSYVGVVIGALNTLFIFPLELEALGLARFLIAVAMLSQPIVGLGSKLLAVRYFPDFKSKQNGHNGFLGLLLLWNAIGFSVFCALAFLFQGQIYDFYSQKAEENSTVQLLEFLPYVLGFALLLSLIDLLSAYISNFHRVVIPHLINNLGIKLAMPLLILLFFYGIVDETIFVQGLLGVYALIVLLLFAYLVHLKELKLSVNFSFLEKARLLSIRDYTVFAVLGIMGNYAATQIDLFMAGSLLDMRTTGTYSLALFIATTIEVPMVAMISITGTYRCAGHKRGGLC